MFRDEPEPGFPGPASAAQRRDEEGRSQRA